MNKIHSFSMEDSPDTYTLSPEQLKFYDDNGYLIIRNFLDRDTLEKYRTRFVQVCNGDVDKGEMLLVKESPLEGNGHRSEHLINKIHDIHYDEVFGTFCEHPKLVDVVAQIIRAEDHGIRTISGMFINKAPGTVAHPPHQDLVYFAIRPASKQTAVWTALDTLGADCGTLYMVPGSHKAGLLYEHAPIPGLNKKGFNGILDETVWKAGPHVPVELAPGDTAFFHPLVVHGTSANSTQEYRKAMSAHYASNSTYFVEVCGGPAARVAQHVDDVCRRRGWNVTYEDLLRYRSKPVHAPRLRE